MSVVRRHLDPEAVAPRKLHSSILQGTFAYEKFNYQPVLTKVAGFGDPTGGTGDTNLAQFRKLNTSYHVKGAGQTILGPTILSGTGLDVSQDQTMAEGAEHVFGAIQAIPNPFRYLVGTTKPVVARLKFRIDDVSGAAEAAFGFRGMDPFVANLDDYTDLAVLNVQNGVINLETILNNAATITTNTLRTWVDGATKELKAVLVGRDVRFFVDGAEVIKATLPYQFASGLALEPFFFFLQAADLTPVYWDEFEFAYLDDIDDTRVSN